MVDCYYNIFDTKLKLTLSSPLGKGEHPELNTYECLDSDSAKKKQSMIGVIQWTVSLGRLYVNTTVMNLASFRAAPRKVHLDLCKRVVYYPAKLKWATISIRTEEPYLSSILTTPCEWEESFHGKVEELTPHDVPTPL